MKPADRGGSAVNSATRLATRRPNERIGGRGEETDDSEHERGGVMAPPPLPLPLPRPRPLPL